MPLKNSARKTIQGTGFTITSRFNFQIVNARPNFSKQVRLTKRRIWIIGGNKMNITSNDELVEIIGEGLLWDIVGNYAETHLEFLKEALRPLGYIDYEDVDKITFAEVRESDEFIINDFSAQEGILTMEYEMPAGILAKNDDGSVCFHVTTWCTGQVEIPDIDSYNWNSIEFDSLNRLQILAYSHLVKAIRLSYEDTEADDLNA